MPLRSATEFPLTPEPEALQETYQDCRAALVSANRSRGVLKAQCDRRGGGDYRAAAGAGGAGSGSGR